MIARPSRLDRRADPIPQDRRTIARWAIVLAACCSLLLLRSGNAPAQSIMYSSGQTVAPSFEGWELKPDGSFDLVFGYLNRNLDEEVDVPIGPDNNVEPGGPDRGQPTHFLPRRNRYQFRVNVPKDFGAKEVVWTLSTKGKTEKAYGSLKPDYVIDELLVMKDVGALGTKKSERENKAPVVQIEGPAQRTAKVGQPLALVATASDDGIPGPKAVAPRYPVTANALGLRVAWYVYRGSGKVTFDPEQFKVYTDYRGNSPWTPGWAPPPLPPDGRFPVNVTFAQPGTYVVRVMGHDGGLQTMRDVTVTVTN